MVHYVEVEIPDVVAQMTFEPLPLPEIQETPCEQTVIVQNGESLSKLAKKYGVTVQELKELNKDQLKTFYNTKNCDDSKGVQGFLVGAEIKLPCSANLEAAKNNKDAKGANADYTQDIIKDRDKLCDERQEQATIYTKEQLDKMAEEQEQKTEE